MQGEKECAKHQYILYSGPLRTLAPHQQNCWISARVQFTSAQRWLPSCDTTVATPCFFGLLRASTEKLVSRFTVRRGQKSLKVSPRPPAAGLARIRCGHRFHHVLEEHLHLAGARMKLRSARPLALVCAPAPHSSARARARKGPRGARCNSVELLPTPSAHAPQSFSCSLWGDLQIGRARGQYPHDIAPAEPLL